MENKKPKRKYNRYRSNLVTIEYTGKLGYRKAGEREKVTLSDSLLTVRLGLAKYCDEEENAAGK